jgi:hypothetical protein
MNSSQAAQSAAAGVTGGYDGNSLSLKIIIAFFSGPSIYNALELAILIFITFSRYRGLYFWSLLVSSLGLIPYARVQILLLLTGNAKWVSVALLTLGWYLMVTGQSVVLWSRLHLIVSGERGGKILKYTRWMIIVDFFILHVPTTVVTFGSNGKIDTASFVKAYNVALV